MSRVGNEYFAEMYATSDDPWGFETKWYEKRKYAITVASLPCARYGRAFELGAASGALTERLAERCDSILAWELVPKIAARARTRLAHLSAVTVETASVPERWPEGPFDLVLASEVLYYLEPATLTEALRRLPDTLSANGHFVAVHYRGATNYPLSGDETHARLARTDELRSLVHHEEEMFVLDVFEKCT